MPLTPQITLTCNLLDYSGAQIGSASSPAYLRIALCGFGGALPCVSGSGMIGKTVSWAADLAYTGAQISVPLWGNDVITPAGTYYMIAVLDANKNVIQAACYQFTGTATLDLSQQSPYLPPTPIPAAQIPVLQNPSGAQTIGGPITINGNLTVNGAITNGGMQVVTFSATPVFNAAAAASFKMTLTGNVTSSTLSGAFAGQIVIFEIVQDGSGNHTFAWPANVHNADSIVPTAGAICVQAFEFDGSYFYPVGPMTVN